MQCVCIAMKTSGGKYWGINYKINHQETPTAFFINHIQAQIQMSYMTKYMFSYIITNNYFTNPPDFFVFNLPFP